MQPSQSFPGKSLLPGLVHGAAEDRREEARLDVLLTVCPLEMGYMDI